MSSGLLCVNDTDFLTFFSASSTFRDASSKQEQKRRPDEPRSFSLDAEGGKSGAKGFAPAAPALVPLPPFAPGEGT